MNHDQQRRDVEAIRGFLKNKNSHRQLVKYFWELDHTNLSDSYRNHLFIGAVDFPEAGVVLML